MVRTPSLHCRGRGFSPWLGKYDNAYHEVQPKINKLKKKKRKKLLMKKIYSEKRNNWGFDKCYS